MDKRFMVGERSLTAAKKIWPKGKEVTPDYLKINDEQFAELVKAKAIVPWQAKPEVKPAARGVATGSPADTKKDLPPSVLRADRVEAAIKALYKEDGTRETDDYFTKDDKPTTDALNLKFDKIEDELEINAAERDVAWEKYLADLTAPDGNE